jgi:uncharacterized membrane protein YcaP (DUF421 family)
MGVDDVLFDQWSTLARVLVVGSLAYVGLVLVLRLSGKRTLAKLNAFDLVVTVALGSTLATVVLSSDVTLAAGIVAIALLVLLQYVVAWVASRSRTLRRVVKSEPTLLLHRGMLLDDRLRHNRVTAGEVRQAVRSLACCMSWPRRESGLGSPIPATVRSRFTSRTAVLALQSSR